MATKRQKATQERTRRKRQAARERRARRERQEQRARSARAAKGWETRRKNDRKRQREEAKHKKYIEARKRPVKAKAKDAGGKPKIKAKAPKAHAQPARKPPAPVQATQPAKLAWKNLDSLWRDKSGRWRAPNGAYIKAPRVPKILWPPKRDHAPDPIRSERAKRGWATRYFHEAREVAADGLRGSKAEDWHVLKAMIENRDTSWAEFLATAEALGKSEREARDEWFSPEL